MENLQAYKFEHLYQQVADIALSTLLPKADQAKTGLAETDSKLSRLKVGHNWTTQNSRLSFDEELSRIQFWIGLCLHKSAPANTQRPFLHLLKSLVI